MNDTWYEEVEARTKLMQGDLILRCPLISWKDEAPQLDGHGEAELLRTMTNAIQADVVVMTQACDLENEKVQNVVLCPHLSLTEYYRAWKAEMAGMKQNPSDKAWGRYCDDIRDGYIWNLAMLNSGNTSNLTTEHRVVDFHDIFTVPRIFLESLLQQREQERLRLLPPYREHLSQAFARYFMRVGLPSPVRKNW